MASHTRYIHCLVVFLLFTVLYASARPGLLTNREDITDGENAPRGLTNGSLITRADSAAAAAAEAAAMKAAAEQGDPMARGRKAGINQMQVMFADDDQFETLAGQLGLQRPHKTTYGHLFNHQYRRKELTVQDYFDTVHIDKLNTLLQDKMAQGHKVSSLPEGPFLVVEYTHESTPELTFRVAYNIIDGIVVRLTSRQHQLDDGTARIGPMSKEVEEQELDEAQVIIAEWTFLAGNTGAAKFKDFWTRKWGSGPSAKKNQMKWFIDPWVSDLMTQKLIHRAVTEGPDHELVPLPGTTFPAGSLGFVDILGSPSGHLVFSLLYATRPSNDRTAMKNVNHVWIPRKAIESVLAYKYEDREEDHEDPKDLEKSPACLAWKLADYTDQLKAQAASRPGGGGLNVGQGVAGSGHSVQHAGGAAVQAGPAHAG